MYSLEYWDERILEIVKKLELDTYDQEFLVVNHNQMIGYMAYGGMPSRYSHWSFGKAYERTKSLYSYGVTGLPYEMVINSDPCLAYLMKDNSLCLQILTIAHVYGHNNFFKVNQYFVNSPVKAKDALYMFKIHARMVKEFIEDPSIGLDQVESTIDHAHCLRFHNSSNYLIKASPEQEKNIFGFDLRENLLGFIAKNSKSLKDWQRYLLEMIEKESFYFLPQLETKIMNEGWASLIHYIILKQLNLPPDLHLEFIVNHSQVLKPSFGSLNPYHLGFVILSRIYSSISGDFDPHKITSDDPGFISLKKIISEERDSSFLRRFLTKELAEELYLFEHSKKGKNRVVSRLPNCDDYNSFRETLIKHIGMLSIPKIVVKDILPSNTLILEHRFDDRELNLEWAEKTLKSIHWLWGNDCILETILNGNKVLLKCTNNEVKIEKLS